jgi:hypothetical protein
MLSLQGGAVLLARLPAGGLEGAQAELRSCQWPLRLHTSRTAWFVVYVWIRVKRTHHYACCSNLRGPG